MKLLALSALLALAFTADTTAEDCTKADNAVKKVDADKHRPAFLEKWKEEKQEAKLDIAKNQDRLRLIREREAKWNALSEEEKQKLIAKRKEYIAKHKAEKEAEKDEKGEKADDRKVFPAKIVVKGLRLDKDGKADHQDWVADKKERAAHRRDEKANDKADWKKDDKVEHDHKDKADKADKADDKDQKVHNDNRDHKFDHKKDKKDDKKVDDKKT